MGSLSAQPSVSLTANGTTSTGSITWTRPNIPAGAIIDSVVLTGTYSWGGKGTVTVTINDTTCTSGTAFNINLPTNVTSPYTGITCVSGNKNSTGNSFTWTGLQITYNYTIYYNVSVGTVTNGTVTLSQTGTVSEGASITITATPNSGYRVGTYYVNGSPIGGNTFNVNADSVVTVDFNKMMQQLYFNQNNTIRTAAETYQKVGSTWVLLDKLDTLFTGLSNGDRTKYIYGGEK